MTTTLQLQTVHPISSRLQSSAILPPLAKSFGQSADEKAALLRSEKRLNKAAMKVLELVGVSTKEVLPVLEIKQEYFVIDQTFAQKRPDLLMLGKTVQGLASSIEQELPIYKRISTFMEEVEKKAVEHGIPIKTRCQGTAPAQYGIISSPERTSLAVDHNILLMEIIQQTATAHRLTSLFDEKPFAAINGSGTLISWSLETKEGVHLFDPLQNPHSSLFLSALKNGIHRHQAVLRASIGSPSNDERLASPNTSSWEFRDNQFEWMAIGASQNASFPITLLNTLMAEALEEWLEAYPNSPIENSEEREISIFESSLDAFLAFNTPSTHQLFKGILSEEQLKSRFTLSLEHYAAAIENEAIMLVELFKTSILPAALQTEKTFSETIHRVHEATQGKKELHYQRESLNHLVQGIEDAIFEIEMLEEARKDANQLSLEEKAKRFSTKIRLQIRKTRGILDLIESMTDHKLWSLPKYRELLYLI